MNKNDILASSIFLIFTVMSSPVLTVQTYETDFNSNDQMIMTDLGPIINDAIILPDDEPIGIMATEPTTQQTSEFMIGDVSVAIILMESNGTIDPNLENWDAERVDMVISEIKNGLNWWAEKESKANLKFTYHIHIIETSYEPISRVSTDRRLWINEAMEYFGYTSGAYYTRVRNFDNDLRNSDGTDWAFTIFVVDSLNDSDGKFKDGFFAFSFIGGPLFVMTYDNAGYTIDNMDAVTAHETGHIFRAADQYSGAWFCNEDSDCCSTHGYLQVENQNCNRDACLSDVPSIMRGGVLPFTNGNIDYYARGQVGWRDEDNDKILDAIDSDYNPDSDTDGDGIVDYWDNCPNVSGIPLRMGCPFIIRHKDCGPMPEMGRWVSCMTVW